MSLDPLAAFAAGMVAGAAAVLLAWRRHAAGRRRHDATLAHDLRTPLSSITAYAEILEEDVGVEERRRFTGIIAGEAQRMEEMLRIRLDRGAGSEVAPTGGAVTPSESAGPPGRTVLVVDDDRFIVDSTRRLLGNEGYRTLCATGGEEAVEKARSGRPDLILMDLMMPLMGGEEALRRLQSDPVTRTIPVIVTSGIGAQTVPEGASMILHKPFSRETLLAAMGRAMSERSP